MGKGGNEWRNIQDIVRLTFKAVTDVLKAQGESLMEIERQIPTRVALNYLASFWAGLQKRTELGSFFKSQYLRCFQDNSGGCRLSGEQALI